MRALSLTFVLVVSAISTGCVGSRGGYAGQIGRGYAVQIEGILTQQATDWNRGDIEAFVEPYWHSPDLTFSSGGVVTRGWEKTRLRYHRRYPTKAKMGQLTFSDLEITGLGSKAALVLGRWHLDRAEPVGGSFSLVFRKMHGRWLIVHDHTSLGGS